MPALDDVNSGDLATRGSPPPGGTPLSSWCRTRRDTPICCGCWQSPTERTRNPTRGCRSPSLCAHADGLILLTGGPEGPLGRLLLEGRREAAEALVAQWREAFGDRLYIELLRHGLENEAATEPALLAIAKTRSADCRHQRRLFHHTRHVRGARCAVVHLAGHAPGGHQPSPPDAWSTFKSGAEMRALFSDLPDAIANTGLIARRCAFAIDSVKPMLPPYDCGEE